MKNLLLLLALALSLPVFSQEKKEDTQPAPQQKFSLGIVGGLNANFMPFNPIPPIRGSANNHTTKPEYAYFVGLSARKPVGKKLAVKMDAQFAQKGYGLKNESNALFVQEHFQAAYLDFVPQLEYNVYKIIYLSLGGYGGVRISERVKYYGQEWVTVDPKFITLTEKTDWGLALGFRAEFGRISALVKYQQGLTPAIKLELVDDTAAIIGKAKQFHQSLQIGLGFKILE